MAINSDLLVKLNFLLSVREKIESWRRRKINIEGQLHPLITTDEFEEIDHDFLLDEEEKARQLKEKIEEKTENLESWIEEIDLEIIEIITGDVNTVPRPSTPSPSGSPSPAGSPAPSAPSTPPVGYP